ncbi:MAG: hypothetical protein ACOYXT_03480 [Bacteroidota bacterium]
MKFFVSLTWLLSGAIFSSAQGIPPILDSIVVTFYRRGKKERADAIHLAAGDTIQFLLVQNSIQQILGMDNSLEVCIDLSCDTIFLERGKVNYVECSWKDGQPEFEKLMPGRENFICEKSRFLTKRTQRTDRLCPGATAADEQGVIPMLQKKTI